MYFTQNDFLKIYEWIKRHSIRDSEFEESTIIEDNDTVTIVTSKGNRKIKIKALIEVFIDKITGGESSLVTKEELDGRQYITAEYVDTIINDLIGAAPETLDTLEELAEALKDNDDIINTLEKAISNKADRSELPSLEGYATEEFVENKGYLTEHQDISGKQDNLVSGTNIKTINNQSILGEGNINIEVGGGSSSSDSYHCNIIVDSNTAELSGDPQLFSYIGYTVLIRISGEMEIVPSVFVEGTIVANSTDTNYMVTILDEEGNTEVQAVPRHSNYATKDEVATMISESITNTLNTEV